MDTQLSELDVNNIYPSIQELLPTSLMSRVPHSLAEDIIFRYKTLGPKYMTEKLTEDKRLINACMYRDSIQDAQEEVIDAVFNTLVWIFKISHNNSFSDNNQAMSALSALSGLIEIYSLLASEQERHVQY